MHSYAVMTSLKDLVVTFTYWNAEYVSITGEIKRQKWMNEAIRSRAHWGKTHFGREQLR
ncbi:hypothetical protein YSY22_23660 [Brevibacillus formosus]